MADVRWVKRNGLEGPLVPGKVDYVLPEEYDDRDAWIAAITAPEGGRYDCVNMYDRGICSFGLIQYIEANLYNLSHFLIVVKEKHPVDFNVGLKGMLDTLGADVVRTKKGPRMTLKGQPVETPEGQRELFLGCDGATASWTPAARLRAIEWASSLSNLLARPDVVNEQRLWVRSRLNEFFFKNSRSLLSAPKTPVIQATQALYACFAVNAPGTSDLIFSKLTTMHPLHSDGWCRDLIVSLAKNDKLPNFERRYRKAKPIVEKAFNVTLPVV